MGFSTLDSVHFVQIDWVPQQFVMKLSNCYYGIKNSYIYINISKNDTKNSIAGLLIKIRDTDVLFYNFLKDIDNTLAF